MFQKYLGVYITNSLNWTKQAVEVKKKANKILVVRSKGTYRLVALLSRNEPICPWSALYASTAPSPGVHIHKKTLIICVESVQRRAARFVCNDYCRSSSVNTMLSNLGWQDLETRREITDLTMFF